MWRLPHIEMYQKSFFLQQLEYEKRRTIDIAKRYNEYSVLSGGKQGPNKR